MTKRFVEYLIKTFTQLHGQFGYKYDRNRYAGFSEQKNKNKVCKYQPNKYELCKLKNDN